MIVQAAVHAVLGLTGRQLCPQPFGATVEADLLEDAEGNLGFELTLTDS